MRKLEQFMEQVSFLALDSNDTKRKNEVLGILQLVCYEANTTLEKIDLNAFSLKAVEEALEDVAWCPAGDEWGEVADEEYEPTNLLLEINRIAHAHQIVRGIKPLRKRKGFF